MVLSILRMIFGLALTLFIPGFALTLALFPKGIGKIERIALGSVLSIALVLLTAITLDLGLGVDFTAENMTISLIFLTVFFILLWFIQGEWLRDKIKTITIPKNLKWKT